MKDIIWTLIVVWFIYKIVAVVRSSSKKQANHKQNQYTEFDATTSPKEESIKSAIQKHLNKEGEYVDFEEIKK